jgi:crotonobetainyl-CoA:carnitine CoA-transferase CaiB-like acyl-CoA transferase
VAHTVLEAKIDLNAAKIGCARVFNKRDQYEDPHYVAREMTVPVLDQAVGFADPRLRRRAENVVDPGRIWRGAPSIGDDTTDILAYMLGLPEGGPSTNYTPTASCTAPEPFTEPRVAAVDP